MRLLCALLLVPLVLGGALADEEEAPEPRAEARFVVVHELPGMRGLVRTLAFRPDGVLASGGLDRRLRFWDVEEGRLLASFRLPRGG